MGSNEVRIHTAVTGNAAKEVKDLSGAWSTFQKKGAEGLAMGVGLAATTKAFGVLQGALESVVDFGKGAVQAASDTREAMSLNQQVFEGNADAIQAWSRASDDAFSSTEAVKFASQFGTAFKNVGMSLDETSDKAKVMTTLAGDLGSAFNASSAEAAQALQSGLLGQSEPMRRFGVFLDEAKVKAKAAAMGMEALGGKLTDGQKVAARYALIMEQTADSQGMFGRDADSAADAGKRLESNMADLQASLGALATGPLADVTGGLAELAAELNGTSASTDAWVSSTYRAQDPLQAIGDGLSDALDFLTAWDKFQGAASERQDAANAAIAEGAESWDTYAEKGAVARESMRKLAGTSARAEHGIGNLSTVVADLVGGYQDLVTWADKAAQVLNPNDIEVLTREWERNRIELLENKDELKDLTGEFEELERKGRKPTRDQRQHMLDLKDAVEDSEDEVISLGIQLVNSGKITFDQLEKRLERLGIDLGSLTGDAAALLRYLRLIDDFDAGTAYDNNKKGIGGKASGGYEPAGSVFKVGEKGEEIVKALPGGGVMVHPLGGGGAYGTGTGSAPAPSPAAAPWDMGGGGPVVVQLIVEGRVMAEAVAPGVTAWQQSRMLLPGR